MSDAKKRAQDDPLPGHARLSGMDFTISHPEAALRHQGDAGPGRGAIRKPPASRGENEPAATSTCQKKESPAWAERDGTERDTGGHRGGDLREKVVRSPVPSLQLETSFPASEKAKC